MVSDIIKDDTLPCKCQALAWKNEPKAWIQGFQALKFFLVAKCSFCSIYHNSVHFECGILFCKDLWNLIFQKLYVVKSLSMGKTT